MYSIDSPAERLPQVVIYIYIYTYIHTYIYMYTYIYIRMYSINSPAERLAQVVPPVVVRVEAGQRVVRRRPLDRVHLLRIS